MWAEVFLRREDVSEHFLIHFYLFSVSYENYKEKMKQD